MTSMPSLFISHGAPDIILRDLPAVRELKALAGKLPRPEAIVIVSAHWVEDIMSMTSQGPLKTFHDFGGFHSDLYKLKYPAKGDEKLSQRITELLSHSGFESRIIENHGLDHGAWIPLKIIYPEADIPVTQLSLLDVSLKELSEYAESLNPLRDEGVLFIGSGSTVHNLGAAKLTGQADEFAVEFEYWLHKAVEGNHFDWLTDSSKYPASFQMAHPTVEHLAPLVFAWAVADSEEPGVRIHQSFDYGNIGMSQFLFNGYKSKVN